MLKGLVSAIWSSVSAGMRWAIRHGWVKQAQLPVRVISVGNIQAGGAGKTPLVAEIARQAEARGLKVCILSRGYGGEWERSGGVILPRDGQADLPRASQCGDEPALLHDLVPGAVIGVGADRIRQFEQVQAKWGQPDLVLLDDGFQHWKIKKDLEIVAVTSAKRTEVFFRDWSSALRDADLLVWTKGETRPKTRPEGGEQVRVRYRIGPPSSRQEQFWLVTGVADGPSVEVLVRAAGFNLIRHISFPDHARYAKIEVKAIIDAAERAGARVLVTGKDWVKWRDLLEAPTSLRVQVLEPELEWLEGRDAWNHQLWER
ncbi:tetraacyldisaccharide 4'-kinase [Bdellovibrionota bacterium FG-1]